MRVLPCLLAFLALVALAPAHAQESRRVRQTSFVAPQGPPLSQGAMFHSLAGYRIPAAGLQAAIVCKIAPTGGWLTDCVAEGGTPEAAVPAVKRRLKTSMNVVQGTAQAFAHASILLKPSDYPALTADDAYQAMPLKLNSDWKGWAARPPQGDFVDRLYPERALRLEREGRVTAICQIQSDGSLACPVVHASVTGMGFEQAGLAIIEFYRAKRRLPNWRRSAGTWVRMVVDFDIP